MREIEKWKVLKSERVYEDKPWACLNKECVELPNGKVIDSFYTMDYPDWINVIAITDEGKFIFVRQYRHGIKEVNFELCAGVCDSTDATPLESAKRELLEETGFGKGYWKQYMTISANPGVNTNLVHTFIATDVVKVSEQALEDTEDLDVHFFTLHEVKQLLVDGDIKQAVMAAPLWKYLAMNQ